MQKSVAFLCLALAVVSAKDCSKIFKDDDTHAKASEKCMKSLNIKDGDFLPKSEEEFKKNFDDKCFGKCFMTEMKFLADSKFDKDAIKKDVEEHIVDADVQKKVVDYTMKCFDEVETKLKSSGGKLTKDTECALPAEFMYCSMVEETKMDLQCDPPADAPKPAGA